MSVEVVIGVMAQVLTTATLLLLYYQTRQLTRQTSLSREEVELATTTAELSYNLELMVRLQEVLYEIADDEQSYAYVWGDVNPRPSANRRPQLSAHALLDVMAMALAASARLPGYPHANDWIAYTEYVLTDSPNVLAEALAHPEWWPEVFPVAEKVKGESHGSDEQSEKV